MKKHILHSASRNVFHISNKWHSFGQMINFVIGHNPVILIPSIPQQQYRALSSNSHRFQVIGVSQMLLKAAAQVEQPIPLLLERLDVHLQWDYCSYRNPSYRTSMT